MRTKAADIAKYVEAVRERAAYERAFAEEPTPARKDALALARGRVKHAEKFLNGSQLGQARRLLAPQA